MGLLQGYLKLLQVNVFILLPKLLTSAQGITVSASAQNVLKKEIPRKKVKLNDGCLVNYLKAITGNKYYIGE